ncbi:MAG: hypothetical protein JWO15_1262 [Sphingomonadales bacterium]|nr:hypothetical protein [Sphingomonadales bacterium]
MHICSILTSFTAGGAETIVANLSDAFVAQGARSTVVALSDASQVGNSPRLEQAIMGRIAWDGGSAESLSLAQRRNIVTGGMALRKFLRRTRPDIIHCHTAQALPMLWLIRPGVPVLFTHHNSRLSFPPLLFTLFDRVVSGYVAISGGCADLLLRHVRRPVTTIYNAAGKGFDVAMPRSAPQGQATVLSVGAISAQKDYPTLIRAAALLRRRQEALKHQLRIQIAGGGAGIAELRALAQAEGVSDMIDFLGARDDVPHLLAAADLFVNCSIYEGLPVAIIEAMKAALPVVATDVAGNNELVRNGANGTLVRSQDPAALADAIIAMLEDGPTYESMSRAARAASVQYSMSACAAAHLTLYRNVIEHRPADERKGGPRHAGVMTARP